MNRKNLFLIGGVLALVLFIGYLGESGPVDLLGFTVNIWIIRLAWLFIAIANFNNYQKIRRAEKSSQ
jgi:hypothetical protein